jgi:antitoxin (DNA-binding transcriptional repressor) of toxin-antitoxin stability system
MKRKTVNLEDRPDLALMVAHAEQGYLTHAVEICRNGEPAAVLLDPEAARCALAIADRLRSRKPPFTQDALNEWIDEVLADFDVPAFMSGG